jgi:hypothetical protein
MNVCPASNDVQMSLLMCERCVTPNTFGVEHVVTTLHLSTARSKG